MLRTRKPTIGLRMNASSHDRKKIEDDVAEVEEDRGQLRDDDQPDRNGAQDEQGIQQSVLSLRQLEGHVSGPGPFRAEMVCQIRLRGRLGLALPKVMVDRPANRALIDR